MTTKTPAERLAEADTAISRVLGGGQSSTVDGKSVTFADIKDLDTIRDKLETKANRKKRGGLRVMGAVFDG